MRLFNVFLSLIRRMVMKTLKGTLLSNFSYFKVSIKGKEWRTAEHLFQACKLENGLDNELTEKIRNCNTPAQAKRMGRTVPLRTDWEEVKIEKMYRCLKVKFKYSEVHRNALKDYWGEIIENNTWHDNFWGNCTCNRCKNVPGENWLGKLLMDLRFDYAEEAHDEYVNAIVASRGI